MRWTTVSSKDIDSEEFRLNASFYLAEGQRKYGEPIERTLAECIDELRKFQTIKLGDLTKEIKLVSRFKRTYVSSPKFGIPFLSGTNITQFNSEPKFISRYLHRAETSNYLVRLQDILLTRSGTVGNIALVWNEWNNWAATDHAIRIIIDPQKIHPGYVLAFLNTEYAQAQILRFVHGSVVDEITDRQVAQVLVPRLERRQERRIGELIFRAMELLSTSKAAVKDSVASLAKRIGNSSSSSFEETASDNSSTLHCVIKTSDELDKSEYHLRAGFYTSEGQRQFDFPVIRTLEESFAKMKDFITEKLGGLTREIRLVKRFKRHYVKSPDCGFPFMSGKNITQVAPSVKYLSSEMHKDEYETLKIEKGWVLVTCSGTVGRIALVWDEWAGWALTQHAIRIIPEEERLPGGYIYAFLNTEFGQSQILRYVHGSVVDEITDKQISNVLIPRLPPEEELAIARKVYGAYDQLRDSRGMTAKSVATLSELIANQNTTVDRNCGSVMSLRHPY